VLVWVSRLVCECLGLQNGVALQTGVVLSRLAERFVLVWALSLVWASVGLQIFVG
jgi:hypothetical protein